MTTEKLYAVAICMLLVTIPVGAGRKEGVEVNRQLKELCKTRITAFAERDVKQLEKICADGYRLINPGGTQMGFSELRKSIAGGKRKMGSFTLYTFQSFVAEGESMAFAIAEVTEEIIDSTRAPVTNNLLVTEVYIKESGRWKIQLTHISQKMCVFPE
jgi:hypothetical protein